MHSTKELAHTLGMPVVSARQFYTTSELMYPHVQDMVDGQCELAKQKMKEKPAAELDSLQNAVTTADGAWLTRGHHSQNFAYDVRDYLTSALLYYQHLRQRGKITSVKTNTGSLISLFHMASLGSKLGALSQVMNVGDHCFKITPDRHDL